MYNALFETSLSAKLLKNNILSHFLMKRIKRALPGNNDEKKTNFSTLFLTSVVH